MAAASADLTYGSTAWMTAISPSESTAEDLGESPASTNENAESRRSPNVLPRQLFAPFQSHHAGKWSASGQRLRSVAGGKLLEAHLSAGYQPFVDRTFAVLRNLNS
jgi:hypothetical protein